MKNISKKVPTKSNYPLFKPACAAVLSVFCSLSPSMVKASCVGLNTANAACTGIDSAPKMTQPTVSSTTQLIDWTLTNGYFTDMSQTSGTQTLIANNVNITNSIAAPSLNIVSIATQGNLDVQITGSTLTSSGIASALNVAAQGIYTGGYVAGTGGTVSLELTDTTISAGAARAMEVTSGNGDVSLEMTRTNVSSDGGVWVASGYNGSGDVKVVTHDGSITATGSYFGADALVLIANSLNSKLTLDNSSVINTGRTGISTLGKNALTSITNSGAINAVKLGPTSDITAGIYSTAINGDIQIDNQGAITASGINNSGIFAQITGTGNAKILNGNDITINGPSTALRIEANTGNASINQNGGDIKVNGAVGNGAIYAITNGIGNAIVNMNGGTVANNSTSNDAHGLETQARGTGDTTIHLNAGSVTTAGGLGIVAWGNSGGTGNATVTTGAGTTVTAAGSGTNAGGIAARGGSSATGTSVLVDSKSVINATMKGIKADSLNGGNVTVVQTGGSITSGATGIYAKTTGIVDVTNSGVITTSSIGAHGIEGDSATGAVKINNSGSIKTSNQAADGIYVTGANVQVDVVNNGDIHIAGTASKGIHTVTDTGSNVSIINNGTILHDQATNYQYGIEAKGASGTEMNIVNNGNISGSLFGIVAWTNRAVHTGSSSNITLGGNSLVDAKFGITADLSDSNTISLNNGARLNGKEIAVWLRSDGPAAPTDTINNSGTITSERDQLLSGSFAAPNATVNFNNQANGLMTGVLSVNNANVAIDNAGQWNLRKFADLDNDLTRETLAVAVSDLGTSGNNTINNSGVMSLLSDNGQASTLNNAGEYSTGYSANTMALGGPAQGQILGVKTFSNSGIIDLSTNNAVGNVLLISGSNTAGTSGGGVYIADGGQLKINTILNEGGVANSQSDMLVVDGTRLGNGATSILVNNVGGAGASTIDNGIEVVRVLDSASSEAGVFKLGARTTAGLYEYDLFQGGVDVNTADGNWYLRSLKTPDNTPIVNPESTVYLRNLNAASTMFMHTLHDRLGEPQFTDSYKTEDNNPSSAWVRVVSNHTDSTGGNGQVDLNTDTNLVHLGADIARWSNNGTDRWNIGVMGAYGQSKIDASAKYFGVTPSGFERNATGKVDGYSVGAYATWYGNKNKPEGAYVDTWAQYGWYDNKVQGNTKAEESYNSRGWTASVEAGYAMIARDEGNNRQLMFEPQIQVAYNRFNSDDHTDASGTRIADNNANGVITRVGARLYSRSTLNDNGIQPFVEANWWYSDAKNSLSFNGQTMEDGTPNSRYELKAGLQGEIAKDWLMWGHAGVQFGTNDFNRYEGMVGIKRIF